MVLFGVQMVVQYDLNFTNLLVFSIVTVTSTIDTCMSMVNLSDVTSLVKYTKNQRFVQLLDE